MAAGYPFYLLADSREGKTKEAEITRSLPSTQPTHGDSRKDGTQVQVLLTAAAARDPEGKLIGVSVVARPRP
jgi:hypothetical protein